MIAVPGVIPVTMPVPGPIVALAGLLLLQVPPAVMSVNVIVCPVQATEEPVTGAANGGVTAILLVTVQPLSNVYDIVAEPEATPLTSPVAEPTVATAILLLVQVPPAVTSLNVVVALRHTDAAPVIAAGPEITETAVVVKQPAPSV